MNPVHGAQDPLAGLCSHAPQLKKKRAWNIRNANATILIGTQINITKVEQKANALVEQKPYFLAVELPCIAKDGCAL